MNYISEEDVRCVNMEVRKLISDAITDLPTANVD
jgi:hypothetical protein